VSVLTRCTHRSNDVAEETNMSFEYLADPARPAWAGLLPGKPEAYFLSKGDGEHAKLFTDTFSVLLSGDETGGQFGIFTATCPVGDIIPTHAHADTHETFFTLDGKVRVFVQLPDGQKVSRLLEEGDFGFVPAGLLHAYRVEEAAQMMGVASGGSSGSSNRWAPRPTPSIRTRRRLSPTSPGCKRLPKPTACSSGPTSPGPMPEHTPAPAGCRTASPKRAP
jgi:quercetin 2,3-dioxygenase